MTKRHSRLPVFPFVGEAAMEYKKSDPVPGLLDGRYTIMYQYEFPRATRTKGKFLPKGTVRLREYLFCDGGHGQLVQLTLVAEKELGMSAEKRVMVDKMLDLNREDKKFHEGNLTSAELSGEIREYRGKKLIDVGQVLEEQEKIGRFASARRVKDSRLKEKRARNWKIRIRVGLSVGFFILGFCAGSILQELGLLNLEGNWFYQEYVKVAFQTLLALVR